MGLGVIWGKKKLGLEWRPGVTAQGDFGEDREGSGVGLDIYLLRLLATNKRPKLTHLLHLQNTMPKG
jgi:hypothetical protein